MARFLETACLVYIVLSGHVFVDCRRIAQTQRRNSELHNHEEAQNHPWCNPFSSQEDKSYHFDVELSENKCTDGACMAIQLLRHKSKPVLEVSGGKSWAAKSVDGTLSWSLVSKGSWQSALNPFAGGPGDLKIDLLTVESVRLFDGTKDQPDKLDITMAPVESAIGLQRSSDHFELEGGLYFNEHLLKQGFSRIDTLEELQEIKKKNKEHPGEMTSETFKVVEKNATQASYAAAGYSAGQKVGGGGAILSVGGMASAAAVYGVAVQTQAVVGTAVVGLVGGVVVGGLIGGAIGLGVKGALVMGGYEMINGYQIVPASRKIFEKLRCLSEFKECSTNVLVPKDRECPRL